MGRKKKTTGGSIEGSAEAKKATHVVLEVLAGLKGPSEAAETLSVSLPHRVPGYTWGAGEPACYPGGCTDGAPSRQRRGCGPSWPSP